MPYHFGKSIHKAIKDRGMTVAEFARRIETSRENAYDIFKRQEIDTGLIRTISTVLEHDFLAESLGLIRTQKFAEPSVEMQHQIESLKFEVQKLHKRMFDLEKMVKLAKKRQVSKNKQPA